MRAMTTPKAPNSFVLTEKRIRGESFRRRPAGFSGLSSALLSKILTLSLDNECQPITTDAAAVLPCGSRLRLQVAAPDGRATLDPRPLRGSSRESSRLAVPSRARVPARVADPVWRARGVGCHRPRQCQGAWQVGAVGGTPRPVARARGCVWRDLAQGGGSRLGPRMRASRIQCQKR